MTKTPDRLKPTKESRDPAGQSRNSNYNNQKQSYKSFCPYACPNCAELGEYLESRYEPLCILFDTGDSIFSPMHEKYHDEDHRSVRNGKVFIDADVIDDLLRKFKK